MNKYIKLSNGIYMPKIGFGTYKTGNEKDTIIAIKEALNNGYRKIDTASFYCNEVGIGKAIKESHIPREEIFLVSKVWNDKHGYENTIKSFNESLKRLDTDYLDLYLIHWPTNLNTQTWRALEDLYKQGKVKSIGVCNFKENHLDDLIKNANIIPMVNQIEMHPKRTQKDIISYCENKNIQVVAWGPLSRGKVFSEPIMIELANKYNKDIGQIILRWHIQNNIVPIPKSSNPKRIKSNIDVFNFELSKEDMIKIDSLNNNEFISTCPDGTTYFE